MRLTKTVVERLPAPAKGYAIHWDGELKGFGVRVTASGVKAFILQRRVQHGKEVRITLGRFGPLTAPAARREATRWVSPRDAEVSSALTAPAARREATKLLGAIATGRDPVAERRQAELAAVTLGEVFTEYLRVRSELRPKTVEDYERVMRLSFGDWRKRPLVEITGDMVAQRHALLGKDHGKASANLSMRVLRALFGFAAANYEVGGKALILANPVKRLSQTRAWYRIDRRETLIKPHQLRPWMDAVLELDNDLVRDYLQLVLLTGLRRNEALGLKWEDVDLLGRTLTVRDTKNHTDHTLPLPDYLAALLGRMERRGAHVFEGPRGRLRNPLSSMKEVTRKSGVKFTSHDLRRGFATAADACDVAGFAVRALLNHKASDVTSGYIVASTERLREPMQKITDYVLRCAGVEASADVLPFERADRREREVN